MTNRWTVLAHERLSIVGVESGAQPLTNKDENVALAVNGEIYNHRVIRKGLKTPYHFKTHSDCEVIIPLVIALKPPARTGIDLAIVPRVRCRCAKTPRWHVLLRPLRQSPRPYNRRARPHRNHKFLSGMVKQDAGRNFLCFGAEMFTYSLRQDHFISSGTYL